MKIEVQWKDRISIFKHIGKHMLKIRNDISSGEKEVARWKIYFGELFFDENVSIFADRYKAELAELRKNFNKFRSKSIEYGGIDGLIATEYLNSAIKLVDEGLSFTNKVYVYSYKDYGINIIDHREGSSYNLLVGGTLEENIYNEPFFDISTCFFKEKFDLSTITCLKAATLLHRNYKKSMKSYNSISLITNTNSLYYTNDPFILNLVLDSFESEIDSKVNYKVENNIKLVLRFLSSYCKCAIDNVNDQDTLDIYNSLYRLFIEENKPLTHKTMEWAMEKSKSYQQQYSNFRFDSKGQNPLFTDEMGLATILSSLGGDNYLLEQYKYFSSIDNDDLYLSLVVELAEYFKKLYKIT